MPQTTVRIVSRLFAPEVGAAAFRLRVLAEAFSDLGHRVEVVTSTPAGSPRIDDGPLHVKRWPVLRDANGNIRGYLQYLSFDVPALARLLSRRRPALLVAEPPPTTGLVVRLVSVVQRVPYVYYAADVWSEAAVSTGAPGFLVAGLRWIESWVLRGAVVVLAVSSGVADQLTHLGADPRRVVVVGNGVDTEVFSPSGPAEDAGAPYFVYTGTMSEWQGADVFLRGLEVLHETHPRARMVFLGQGSDLPHLKALAARLDPGTVEFRGVVPPDEAARVLRGATAALVSIKPGLGYDFAKPTKIYAATACGTPVVFAGQGASHDLVTEEGLGWSPGYDPAAIAAVLTDAIGGTSPDQPTADHLVAWTAANASLSSAARAAVRVVTDALPLR